MAEPSNDDFGGRIALVTGASRGIGAAIALALGRAGAQVIAVARTVGGLEELDDGIRKAGGPAALLVPHDLGDLEHIDRLGASLYERFGKLDIFVGAAARLGILAPIGHVDPKIWNDVFALNVTANYRLLRTLDPLLRRSDAGRVVLLGDSIAARNLAYWGPYTASKAALESLALSYAAEHQRTTLRCNLWCPPPSRTALRAQAFPGEEDRGLAAPDEHLDQVLQLASKHCRQNGAVVGSSP